MKKNMICNTCKYFNTCGDVERVAPCDGYEKAVVMKTVKQIENAIKRNLETINNAENEITALSMKNERAAASNDHDIKRWKELNEISNANAGKIAELCEKVYMLKIENMILADNKKARIFADFMPVLADACKPFIGKPYGEKTREKISSTVRAAGYSFYFDGRGYIGFVKLDDRGYACGNDYIKAYSTPYPYNFITDDNRLVFNPDNARISIKYTENPKSHAKQVVKAYEAYKKALEAAEKAQTAFNNMKPACIDHFNKVQSVYKTLV